MKKFLIIILVVILISNVPTLAQEKRNIAVISLQAFEGISQGEAEILTDRLRTELLSTGAFAVMERAQMDEILKEQGFQQSGCTSTECMVSMGRILSVREIMGGSAGRFGEMYTMSLRIIDVETSRIIESKSDDIKGDITWLLTHSTKKLACAFAKTEYIPAPQPVLPIINQVEFKIDTSEVKMVENSPYFLVEKEDMVLLAGGEFSMGSNIGDEDEKPAHKVKLSPFWIDKYEVTVKKYKEIAAKKKTPMPIIPKQPKWNPEEHPIVNIESQEAINYAKVVGKRLPTEAEWEYTAKCGEDIENYWGADNPNLYENLKGTGGRDNWKYTSPPGSFSPNRFGLYDMLGNVSEWCLDEYLYNYYQRSPNVDPVNLLGSWGFYKVYRGGNYESEGYKVRCSNRSHTDEGDFLGFRCVRTATPEEIKKYIASNPNYGKVKQ
jgi:formylglycine-generating enzyme required for sulfatase activity